MKRVIIVILKLVFYNFSCSDYDLLITVTIIIPLLDAQVKNLFLLKYSVVKMLSCIIPSNLNGVLESSPPQMSFPCVMDDCLRLNNLQNAYLSQHPILCISYVQLLSHV